MRDQVTLKGSLVNLNGDFPNVGETAADFTFVRQDLIEGSLYDIENKAKIIISVPSIDTGVCAKETRTFNEKIGALGEKVAALVISKDLPFALKRFCGAEGISNVMAISDYRYNDFGAEYNAEMLDNGLKGLLVRSVLVLDKNNKITYSELVTEVTSEPDYDKAIEALEKVAK